MRSRAKARPFIVAAALLVTSVVEYQALIGEAYALIGRPLTPMSFAGVARRTTRRTVAVGAAAGGMYYGGGMYGGGMYPGAVYW